MRACPRKPGADGPSTQTQRCGDLCACELAPGVEQKDITLLCGQAGECVGKEGRKRVCQHDVLVVCAERRRLMLQPGFKAQELLLPAPVAAQQHRGDPKEPWSYWP